MSRELISKTVDDHLYEFSQFSATMSLKVLSKLIRILGEPLTLAMGAFFKNAPKPAAGNLVDGVPAPVAVFDTKSILSRDIDVDILAKAVHALIERLDEDEVVSLVKRLTTESVLCDHKPIVFDDHFQGRIDHLFKVLFAALEVQYGNFIGVIAGQLPSSKQTPIGVR